MIFRRLQCSRSSHAIVPLVSSLFWTKQKECRRPVVLCDDTSTNDNKHVEDKDTDDDDDETTTTTNNNKNDKEKLFEGQCLERQLYHPKLPYPAWDYNWDGRTTSDTTLEALSKKEGYAAQEGRGKTRHILLIRHGQYDETHKDDDKKQRLTNLGRIQAKLTGQRLATMMKGYNYRHHDDDDGGEQHQEFGRCHIVSIQSSDMTRAKETADIIRHSLSSSAITIKEPDPLLNEGLPAPIIPVRPDVKDATPEIDVHAHRIERAFHKYMYRHGHDDDDVSSTTPRVTHDDNNNNAKEQKEDDDGNDQANEQQRQQHEFEVIVCHGNVIRYFVCRALQIPPEAWLRMSIFNCSLTYIMIRPNGYCTCRMLGDIGHLGYEHTTFSGKHGLVWS